MALLTRDQIWSADDITFEDVPVPEWGGSVRIRGMSGRERDAFEAASLVNRKGTQELNVKNIRARLVAACAIDENGQPLFSSADVMRLSEKSAAALTRLFVVAQRLSGMTEDDVEELAGNLDSDQNGNSTSG
jgi:hypothetical protein